MGVEVRKVDGCRDCAILRERERKRCEWRGVAGDLARRQWRRRTSV